MGVYQKENYLDAIKVAWLISQARQRETKLLAGLKFPYWKVILLNSI